MAGLKRRGSLKDTNINDVSFESGKPTRVAGCSGERETPARGSPARSMLAVGPSSSDAAASSPAADPLFSPGSGPERPATAMPPHPKAQPTLASFFGAKKQISPPEPAPDAAASAPAPALVAAALGSGEELVGCAVEILWESDREWYSGTVQSCTPAGAHVIDYEDGSNVTHDMSKMQYRVLARPGNPRAAQSSDPPERTAAAAVESAPAPLAPIFGAAKKTARAADQTAASQKAAAGPLAPIFGKPAPKRKASTEEPSRSSTTAKVKRERAAAAQPQAQTTKPTKSAPAKEAAAPHTGKVPDLFLTKKQKQEREERLRKQEQEESLRKLREQQERNRVVDEALRKGKATNPFFEQRPAAREPARSDNCPQLERCDASSPLFATLPWLLPGGVAHIAQRQQPSQPSARPVLPAKALRDSALSSHVPAHTSLLPQGREREREHLRTAASQLVCSFLYHPLEDGAIEEFARSLPVIKLLCGESKDYSALGRAAKVLVNTFHRCLGWRYGRVRTASGEPRTRTAHDLWTVLYRPMCAADVCGNRQDVARLATWLQRMKSNMMTAKQNPVRKYKDGSDSDYESDDFADSAANGSYARLSAKDQSALWETSTEFNVVLLSGPAGCGKSAAIHAASQECGYSIIEMNASEKRTGKAVQAKCGEATQSHGLQKWQGMAAQEISPPESSEANSLKRKSAGSKLALKKKAKTADSSSLAATSDGSPEASLIVFEEVDVLFDDDQGFFAALSTLESTTKRPIVMTSSSTFIEGLPDRLPTLNSAFEAPSAKEIRDLLRCICLVEGVDVRVNEAENLVERFNCDMRALLMDAQMRFQGEGKHLALFHEMRMHCERCCIVAAGLLVPQQANRPSRKARQQTDHTEEPGKRLLRYLRWLCCNS